MTATPNGVVYSTEPETKIQRDLILLSSMLTEYRKYIRIVSPHEGIANPLQGSSIRYVGESLQISVYAAEAPVEFLDEVALQEPTFEESDQCGDRVSRLERQMAALASTVHTISNRITP